MKEYKIGKSENIALLTKGFVCCGPAPGLPATVNAEDMLEALKKAISYLEIEWAYDLEGEWIEVSDDSGSLGYSFCKNPAYDSCKGSFDYKGARMFGTAWGRDEMPEDEEDPSKGQTQETVSIESTCRRDRGFRWTTGSTG